jgi:hypothetical protein
MHLVGFYYKTVHIYSFIHLITSSHQLASKSYPYVTVRIVKCPCKCHKGTWGVDVWLHSFLIQALDGGQWRVSCSGHFTPEYKCFSTNCVEGWVDLRAILNFS